MKQESVQNLLTTHGIKWKFNLSRAPWWGGQFERMVALVKNSLYKCVGKGSLTYNELTEVLLDKEVVLNNRPLSYMQDVHLPTLTPDNVIFPQPNLLPKFPPHEIENIDLRKRASISNE